MHFQQIMSKSMLLVFFYNSLVSVKQTTGCIGPLYKFLKNI